MIDSNYLLSRPVPIRHPLSFACLSFAATALFAALITASAQEPNFMRDLQAFQYGKDAKILAQVESLVATATSSPAIPGKRAELAAALAKILETDASYEAKQFVCRQLAIIGTAAEVPVLARMLTEEKWSDMARYALGTLRHASVDTALRDALTRTTGNTRVGIIYTLGARQDAGATKALGDLLGHADPATAQAAALALGQIGGTEAAALLKPAWEKASGEQRQVLADACLACAERLITSGNQAEAVSLYQALYRLQEASVIRAGALRGLVFGSGPDGVRFATAALKEKDPLVVKAAISCVQTLPGTETSQRLAAELPKLSVNDQLILIGALANRGDAAVVPALVKAANGEQPAIRIAALQALGKTGGASVVDLLVSAAGKGGEEQVVALASLRSIQGPGIDEAITRYLREGSKQLRAQLPRVLAARQAVSAVPALLAAASDPDPQIASEAAKALGQLAAPAQVPTLLKTLAASGDDRVREALEEAIVVLALKNPDPASQAAPVLAALQDETREHVRCSLLRVLGGIGHPSGIKALQTALKNGTPAERDAAVRSLAGWPNTAATDVLLTVFTESTTPTHRALALRGCLRLLEGQTNRPPAELLAKFQLLGGKIRGPEETRMFLSGLSTLEQAQALDLVLPFLDQPAVREEAGLAALTIAKSIAGANQELARTTLNKVTSTVSSPTLRQQANELVQILDRFQDYVTAWQISGPYTQPGKTAPQLFNEPFAPEQEKGNAAWRQVIVNVGAGQLAIVDLMGLLGGSDRIAYLRTWIHSEQAQPARLEMGSDDGLKVWLNRKVVHANNVDRGLVPGQDIAPVSLQAGWNELLVKVSQGGGGWAACVRLRGADGSKLSKVRFDATREQTSTSVR